MTISNEDPVQKPDPDVERHSHFNPPQAAKRADLRRVLGLLKEQGLSEAEAYQRLSGDPKLRRVLEEMGREPG